MIAMLLGLQVLTLLLLLILFLRRPATPAESVPDPRLTALLGADLPDQLARVETRSETRMEGLERLLRAELAQLRQQSMEAAERGREGLDTHSATTRRELLDNLRSLGDTLHKGLEGFRGDGKADAETAAAGRGRPVGRAGPAADPLYRRDAQAPHREPRRPAQPIDRAGRHPGGAPGEAAVDG